MKSGIFLTSCSSLPCRAMWNASVGHQISAKFNSPWFFSAWVMRRGSSLSGRATS